MATAPLRTAVSENNLNILSGIGERVRGWRMIEGSDGDVATEA